MLVVSARFSWRRVAFFLVLLSLISGLLAVQLLRRGPATGTAPAAIATIDQVEGAVNAAVMSDPRWGLWKFSLEKIVENPLLGGGIGRGVFDKLYSEYMPEDVLLWHAHNMILNKGIQMGIPGMIVFLVLWVALAIEMLKHCRRPAATRYLAMAGFAAVVAVFTKNMTDDFFVRNVALLFWLTMGLLIGFLRNADERSDVSLP